MTSWFRKSSVSSLPESTVQHPVTTAPSTAVAEPEDNRPEKDDEEEEDEVEEDENPNNIEIVLQDVVIKNPDGKWVKTDFAVFEANEWGELENNDGMWFVVDGGEKEDLKYTFAGPIKFQVVEPN